MNENMEEIDETLKQQVNKSKDKKFNIGSQ